MNAQKFAFINKRDFLMVLALAVLAAYALYYIKSHRGAVAEIIWKQTVVETVVLSRDRVFSIQEVPNVVFEVKDGAIAFIESDCPDKICIHSGWLANEHESAACLPNQLIVRIRQSERR